MRKIIVSSIYDFIVMHSNIKKDYELIKYGIEALYLNITKIFVIIILSFILGYLKETVLFLFLFNNLRLFGFGVHANRSIDCWVASLSLFLILPIIGSNFLIPFRISIFAFSFAVSIFLIYAPAGTVKRPVKNMRKRTIYKVSLVCLCLIYFYLSIITASSLISSLLILSVCLEAFLVTPLAYKVFGVSYVRKGGDTYA